MNIPQPKVSQGNSCPSHASYEELTYHMEEIRTHLQRRLQGSVAEKKSSVCRVLTGMGKITGIAVLGAVATAGVIGLAPVIASVTGASLPASFVGGALFNWVNDFGVGAVSAWTVETAKQAVKAGNGESEQFLKEECQKAIDRMVQGDVEFITGILEMIKDNNLLHVFESEMGYLNTVFSEQQNGAEISQGIQAAKKLITGGMLSEIKRLQNENAKLRDEHISVLEKKDVMFKEMMDSLRDMWQQSHQPTVVVTDPNQAFILDTPTVVVTDPSQASIPDTSHIKPGQSAPPTTQDLPWKGNFPYKQQGSR